MTAPAATDLRLCECGEWTYAPVCGGPCRRPACPRCLAPAGSEECCSPELLARLVHVPAERVSVGAMPYHRRGARLWLAVRDRLDWEAA